jgi:membrane glycosyltransferase
MEKIISSIKEKQRFPLYYWRPAVYCLLVFITIIYGVLLMMDIINANQANALDYIILALFTICFGWISFAFWSAVIGFLLLSFKRDPLTLKKLETYNKKNGKDELREKTAIVMPVYNEDTDRVMAGIESTLRSLANTGKQKYFDFYLLSDSTDNTIANQESASWKLLKKRLKPLNINLFYRRREKNSHRKVGNIADFCTRWGKHYEHMIVLDADSIMGGDTLVSLVLKMQHNPNAGLIQTIPIPVRQQTFFGRFLQFSAELYCPLLATGNSFWQTDTGNYWGHNAIIRTKAFIECCGLPTLIGRPPFGGEILSHDFVEAALLKRGGWQVLTVTERVDSYEEVPSNIIDFITRDRRWAQGNIQHLKLLKVKGFHWISRLHMLFGALAYISSFLWLIMLTLGTADAILTALNSNQFFTQPYQLFPNWKVVNSQLIYSLFGLTALLLLTPKLLSLVHALFTQASSFGGKIVLIFSTLFEIVTAIVIAPIMMIFHAYVVIYTLIGAEVTWNSQPRNGRNILWSEAFQCTAIVMLCASIWGGLSYLYAANFFWWMLPVLIGLVLATPIVRYSGSFWLGRLLKRLRLFITPSESSTPTVLVNIDEYASFYSKLQAEKHDPNPISKTLARPKNKTTLPEEVYTKMPIQQL